MDDDERWQDLDLRWRELNEPFTQNDRLGPLDGPEWILEARRRSVVLSAVHGVRHARSIGAPKKNDANTGGLARAVAEHVGVSSAVIVRALGGVDANATDDHPFKTALVDEGLLSPGAGLLDVHGMDDRRDVDIALGRGTTCGSLDEVTELVADVFVNGGYVVDCDGSKTGLRGAGSGTMVRWARGLGVVAVQIEIARRHRSFLTPPEPRRRLLETMVAAVQAIEDHVTG